MLRNQIAALCIALVLGAAAQAGVLVSFTESINPPGTMFTTDTGYNASPGLGDQWKSYILNLSTNDGTNISVVDLTLTGFFNQRWAIDPDEGFTTPNPTANVNVATSTTTADSHLLVPANPVIFSSPSENNNQASPYTTGPDTATRDYGVGTTLSGAWGYVPGETFTSINVAYLVVPKTFNPSDYRLHIEIDTDPNQEPVPLIVLDNTVNPGAGNPFCPGPFCIMGGGEGTAPDVDDFLHPQMDGSADANLMPIMHTFTQQGGDLPITWDSFMLESYTPNYSGAGTGPLLDATFDPATQKFTWNPIGSPRGDYVWKVTATNEFGSDVGRLTVQIKSVPEPTTFGLAGLALVGIVGLIRRRS